MPQKTLQNINHIAFIFFAVLGATHILAMLSMANGYLPGTAKTIYQIMDIPFLLSALIYGGSAFQIGLNKIGLRSQVLTTILITFLSIIFLLALYTNFFFPDY
ncbi:MAG: hypothetical protein WCT46_03815 [Candidatus Gracilibacteria bacterium]|jgi:hypothetical protein